MPQTKTNRWFTRPRSCEICFYSFLTIIWCLGFVLLPLGSMGGAREYHATFKLIISMVSLVIHLGCIQGSKRARKRVNNINSVSLALGETRQAKIFICHV